MSKDVKELNELTKVTSKDKRDVILGAYEELKTEYKTALKIIKDTKATVLDPVAQKEEQRIEEVFEEADAIISKGVLHPDIVKGYESVQEAIKLLNDKLNSMYGIEAEMDSLAAVRNAQVALKTKTEAEIADAKLKAAEAAKIEKDKVEAELATIKNEIAETKKKRIADDAEFKANLEKQRTQEQEDYDYKTKKARRDDEDSWEVKKKEREVAVKAREDAVTIREQNVLAQETELAELKAQVASIPALIKKAEDAAFNTGKNYEKKDHELATKETKAQHDALISIKDNKIEMLESQLNKALEDLSEAKNEVAAARQEVKEIATETVKASGNAKQIDMMQSFVRDTNSKSNK